MNVTMLFETVGLTALAGLVTVWLAYPLAMAALAGVTRLRRRSATAGPATVSVIIATRESPEATLERAADCLRTDYDPGLIEVVLVADHTSPGVGAYEGRITDPRIRVVDGDAPGGKALTLNAGVRAARGEVLVFTDTFQRFDRQSIPLLVRGLEESGVGAASGRLELPSA